jgi:hypothetical protein
MGYRYAGSVMLEWQYMWLIWAANRLLMFTVLLVVVAIWRPKSTSLLYARMDQVPSQEPKTPSASPSTRGIEMMPVPCALDPDTPRALPPLRKPSRSLLSHTTTDDSDGHEEGDEEPDREHAPQAARRDLL